MNDYSLRQVPRQTGRRAPAGRASVPAAGPAKLPAKADTQHAVLFLAAIERAACPMLYRYAIASSPRRAEARRATRCCGPARPVIAAPAHPIELRAPGRLFVEAPALLYSRAIRALAQLGSVTSMGCGGRQFESDMPDHFDRLVR